MFSYFGGIDFSGAREPLANLWSAVGTQAEQRLRIIGLRPHAFRADLATYVTGGWRDETGAGRDERILWGADFPFGLPAAAADRLLGGQRGASGWAGVLAWAADRPADELRAAAADHLRDGRVTDTGGALPPLDLRLYKQTAEGLRWLHELREAGVLAILPQAPEPHAQITLIEVYPAGAAQELGLPRRRAPSRPGEARARAAALRTYLEFADRSIEAAAVTLEDAWDATIACLTAWLCRDDLDQPRRASASRSALEMEGWIYRPPAAVEG